jgi:hypothetical protein
LRDELARLLAYATGGDAVAAFKAQPVAEAALVAAAVAADDGKKKKVKAKKA